MISLLLCALICNTPWGAPQTSIVMGHQATVSRFLSTTTCKLVRSIPHVAQPQFYLFWSTQHMLWTWDWEQKSNSIFIIHFILFKLWLSSCTSIYLYLYFTFIMLINKRFILLTSLEMFFLVLFWELVFYIHPSNLYLIQWIISKESLSLTFRWLELLCYGNWALRCAIL